MHFRPQKEKIRGYLSADQRLVKFRAFWTATMQTDRFFSRNTTLWSAGALYWLFFRKATWRWKLSVLFLEGEYRLELTSKNLPLVDI